MRLDQTTAPTSGLNEYSRNSSLIRKFYSGAHLMSEAARRVFVLPDLAPYRNATISLRLQAR